MALTREVPRRLSFTPDIGVKDRGLNRCSTTGPGTGRRHVARRREAGVVTTDAEDCLAVVALGRLLSAYADVVNRRAWPEMEELFTSDCRIELDVVSSPLREIEGPAELARFVGPSIERFDHFEVIILNSVFEVDGDRAKGRVFLCEVRHDGDADTWSTAFGLYQDRYQRVDGRWWFVQRRYRSLARRSGETVVFGLPEELDPILPSG